MDIQGIKKMPVAKCILIAQDIWDSIEDKDSIELNDGTKAELDRCIAHHTSGNAKYYFKETKFQFEG